MGGGGGGGVDADEGVNKHFHSQQHRVCQSAVRVVVVGVVSERDNECGKEERAISKPSLSETERCATRTNNQSRRDSDGWLGPLPDLSPAADRADRGPLSCSSASRAGWDPTGRLNTC